MGWPPLLLLPEGRRARVDGRGCGYGRATHLIHIQPRTLTKGVHTTQQRQTLVLPARHPVLEKRHGHAAEIRRAHDVDVDDGAGARAGVGDGVDRQRRVEPFARLEDAGARDGVVDAAVQVECRAEQRVDVGVGAHVAGDEGGGAGGVVGVVDVVDQGFGGGLVDVTEHDVGAVVGEEGGC